MTDQYFIIDFDSTIVKVEALDELSKIALQSRTSTYENKTSTQEEKRGKEEIVKQIAGITRLGMEGKITFPESLSRRLSLFKPTKTHIAKLIRLLKKNITPSIERNIAFFQTRKDSLYIISGGFADYIIPIAKMLGIDASHVLANRFVFDKNDCVVGYDTNNPLSQKGGKAKAVQSLGLKGTIHVIGDGMTDYEVKADSGVTRQRRVPQNDGEEGEKVIFYAFTENVYRENVAKLAEYVVPNFDDFLYLNHFPRAISYPKNRIKVLLLEKIDPLAVEVFQKEGYTVETIDKALGEEELIQKIKDVSVLGIRSKTEITEKVLQHTKKLLAVGAFCIGTNQINLIEAAKKGVNVFNAPFSNTRSVVELVLGEIIMLMRSSFDKSTKLHKGVWDKSARGSYEVRGKTLGIIGYGNIGSQLSVLAESLGMQVIFYNTSEKLALGNAKKAETMEEVLKASDVVTVHVSGKKENTHLISAREFKLMKPGVIFLNVSRGFVVDLEALAKHIKSGKVRGAGIDVFPKEPKSNNEKFESVLQQLPNVILTPHVGGSTHEAQRNIADFVSARLSAFINSGDTTLSVNFPRLSLPKSFGHGQQHRKQIHRLIHIHHNVPGVLAKVNMIFAKHAINIEGQYLGTNNEIGYVITDINADYNESIIDELKEIGETIRLRILY